MAVDLSSLVSYTQQLSSLQDQANKATDPTLKLILQSQITTTQSMLTSEAQHLQSQSDASSSLLNGLGLFATLTSTIGGAAPSIIALLKP